MALEDVLDWGGAGSSTTSIGTFEDTGAQPPALGASVTLTGAHLPVDSLEDGGSAEFAAGQPPDVAGEETEAQPLDLEGSMADMGDGALTAAAVTFVEGSLTPAAAAIFRISFSSLFLSFSLRFELSSFDRWDACISLKRC